MDMDKYQLWIRLNPLQTTFTFVWATDPITARQIGEAQFGVGNVLNVVRVP
jgi:hypothetical protein